MANHGYLKTSKKMRPKDIKNFLDGLNSKYFQDCLNIGSFEGTEDDTLELWYSLRDRDTSFRAIFYHDEYNLEFRHCTNGGSFMCWIEGLIIQELAKHYDGLVTDDSCEGSIPLDTYKDNYLDYIFHKYGVSDQISKADFVFQLKSVVSSYNLYN